MKRTNVPIPQSATESVLGAVATSLDSFTPEIRKAATYVLENPADIGVSSVREISLKAQVKPNTVMRLARSMGFTGFEDFRRPFREQIREGRENFQDKARWLQSLASGGKLDGLYRDMAGASMDNISGLYSGSDADKLRLAADEIVGARTTFVLGVGLINALARNFAYLANMAVDNVEAIPREGSLPADGLARAGKQDVLLAMTLKPYRREVVEAVEIAVEQGVRVISVSDSPASPIFTEAIHRFVVPTQTPQFFTSSVALTAFLETLMAFVIADADDSVIASIERFHQRRHEMGIYCSEG
ncbi:MAG: MurR/RpiR family transcriptional regulator [Pseudomonadota bacterium]